MLHLHQHPHNKSVVVALLGAPNVGKSSLANQLMGMDLSAVTPRPQTTRNRFHCVFTVDRTEVVLVDTPGLHRASSELNRRMNQEAQEAPAGADINWLLVDLSRDILSQFTHFVDLIDTKDLKETWAVFTKSDLIEHAEALPLEAVIEKAKELLPMLTKHFVISNINGTNLHQLIGAIGESAPNAPHLYPNGDISNRPERFFVTEYIREQAFLLLKEEVPYELAVVIDSYRDHRDHEDTNGRNVVCHISASIIVNRPSQRAIVVGSKGQMIKEIGSRAREKIEELVGGQVHLNLHVKVMEQWFKNNLILEELGLPRAKDSVRVWRKK